MEPTVVEKNALLLVGMVSRAEMQDIGALWETFTERESLIQQVIPGVWYELHEYPKGHTWGDPFFLMVGVGVTRLEAMAETLFGKVLAPCHYAVFTHRLGDAGFAGANEPIEDWLTSSSYERSRDYDLQVFDDRFKGPEDAESVLEFWIPVRLKSGAERQPGG